MKDLIIIALSFILIIMVGKYFRSVEPIEPVFTDQEIQEWQPFNEE